ncbi:hypothetical protein BaRGS_00026685, partial [Batillaria attramentaria]
DTVNHSSTIVSGTSRKTDFVKKSVLWFDQQSQDSGGDEKYVHADGLATSSSLTAVSELTFHPYCGKNVKLSGDRVFAERDPESYGDGIVMTIRPLNDDEMFEISLDDHLRGWPPHIVFGVTTHNPTRIRLPIHLMDMPVYGNNVTVLLCCGNLRANGILMRTNYSSFDHLKLQKDDTIGVMRKSDGCLHFYINGEDQGRAAKDCPMSLWGVFDLFLGTVTATSLIDNRGGEWRDSSDQTLAFHHRCGSNAIVSENRDCVERDPNTYGSCIVMTNRPLKDDELFEIRLESQLRGWVPHILLGVTTHNPRRLRFPTHALTGDTIGVMRGSDHCLRFYVNGEDQGAAASDCPDKVWGIVDLFLGTVIKISIVEHPYATRPDPVQKSMDLRTNWNETDPETKDLAFHRLCGQNVFVAHDGSNAGRNPETYGKGIVMTNRPLRDGELFEIRLQTHLRGWVPHIVFGVTTHNPNSVAFPNHAFDFGMTALLSCKNVRVNGEIVTEDYGEFDHLGLQKDDTIGVVRSSDGCLRFFVRGEDQGVAVRDCPEKLYGVADLFLGTVTRIAVVNT